MKTLSKLLSVAVIASSCLMAGGPFTSEPVPDVEPVEPAVAEIPQVLNDAKPESNIQPYFGGALGSSSASVKSQAKVCGGCQYDKLNQTTSKAPDKILNWGGSDSTTTGTVLAGAEITDNIAIEGRLTKAISDYEIKDHKPISYSNAAIYLKPQYKFDDFTLYALLGYGISSIDFMGENTKSNGFQYGAGGSYDVNDQLSVFADYTKLMGSSKKISEASTLGSIDSVNAGIIFKP
jgi:opacity protein-like surface antigen